MNNYNHTSNITINPPPCQEITYAYEIITFQNGTTASDKLLSSTSKLLGFNMRSVINGILSLASLVPSLPQTATNGTCALHSPSFATFPLLDLGGRTNPFLKLLSDLIAIFTNAGMFRLLRQVPQY